MNSKSDRHTVRNIIAILMVGIFCLATGWMRAEGTFGMLGIGPTAKLKITAADYVGTVHGSLVVKTNATVTAFLNLTPSSLNVNAGAAITPTSSLVLLNPTNDLSSITQTNTVSEPGVNGLGRIVIFRNVSATNVLIAETATLIMAGNVTLGTDDAIAYSADTTNTYRELYRVNN